MVQTTTGFVISTIKYNDTSAILKAYTKDFGMMSFFKKGAYSKKSKGKFYFFPLTEVEITFFQNQNSGLSQLRQISEINIFSKANEVNKNVCLLFISEVLNTVLYDMDGNTMLYSYLKEQMLSFSLKDNTSLFHVSFLADLTKSLGFYPNLKDVNHYFDMELGVFRSQESKNCLGLDLTKTWKKLFLNQLSSIERENKRQLIRAMLDYYNFHIPNFKYPKSLKVLEVTFD